MSSIRNILLNLLPKNIRRKVRNKYYEIKISRATEQNEEDLYVISRILTKGNVAVDVGANYGIYTKHFSKYVGKDGLVFSFEPIEQTYKSFRHNIEALNLNNVNPYHLALSEKEGYASMKIPSYEKGGENFYEAQISADESEGHIENVKISTLDIILPEKLMVHFIKIDVEGHEIEVLKGSKECLKRCAPVLLIEINGGIKKDNPKASEVLNFLAKYNYKAFIRKDKNLVKIEGESEGFNFFFLNASHQEKFQNIIS